MVCPEGGGLLHQVAPDAVLQHSDHPLYLPIGLAFASFDVVMDDPYPFTESCKAICKLGTIVHLDIVLLAPVGYYIIVKEYGGPLAI